MCKGARGSERTEEKEELETAVKILLAVSKLGCLSVTAKGSFMLPAESWTRKTLWLSYKIKLPKGSE